MFMISVRAVVPTFDKALNNRRHFNTTLDDCDLWGEKRSSVSVYARKMISNTSVTSSNKKP